MMKKKYRKLLAILPTVSFIPFVVAAKMQHLPPEWRENFKFDKRYVREFNPSDLQNNPSEKFSETSDFRTFKRAVGTRASYRLNMNNINVHKNLEFKPKNESLIEESKSQYGYGGHRNMNIMDMNLVVHFQKVKQRQF